MLSPIRHPVFGTLVPDQWDTNLLTFRQFPEMKLFWHPDPDNAVRCLEDRERAWVQDWQRHTAELARVCRNGDVHSALQSLGVYEVTVQAGKDGQPSPEQVATYQFFLQHEAAFCRNMLDALLRYYRHARDAAPDWFGDDFPNANTVEELAPLVRFDGIGIGRRPANGFCVVSTGWDPDWDPEHGLQMIHYRDQVLEIAPSGESLLLNAPEEYLTFPYSIWGPGRLNEAERAALNEYLDGRKRKVDGKDAT